MNKDYEGKDIKGTILRIERSSIHDGSGFRTVVFLKGCPLHCQWCSTPESQSFKIETTETKKYGVIMSVEDVMKEIRKDSAFYFHSGGGMSLSGGELLAQSEFSRCLLQQAQSEGFNTAIETTFYSDWDTIESIVEHVNTIYVDIKFFNDALHKKYCGVSNKQILESLLCTNNLESDKKLVVRVPLITGINDSEKELVQIGLFCRQLSHLDHVQLLPYHRLGSNTYKELGRTYKLKEVEPPSPEHLEKCREIVRHYVKNVR